ncbi:MAG: outer membrane beta-barrel protein [Chitinophagaceae bacterium]|nr:outer membrane beta-barrel protein [Chitinophagaceae bacterium]
MRYIMVAILIWTFIQHTSAQSGNITGSLSGQTVGEQYTLKLMKASDSSLYKLEIVEGKSAFQFEQIPYGNWFIQVCRMQKILYSSPVFALQTPEYQTDPLVPGSSEIAIKEVKVLGEKNLLEKKTDKLIFHVDRSLEAPGNDALMVLQKAPGISVDPNGRVSMRGKSGVIVMVNGKPTYLSGEQLASLLRSTTAAQIAKIEIISNPSSRYDAEGNAGIVNIILRKDQRRGSHGAVTLSYGKGRYKKSNQSISLNHRQKKFNGFASYNFVANTGFNDLRLYRKFSDQGVLQGAYRQQNYLLFPFYNHSTRIGVDYTKSSKTTFGVLFTGLLNTVKPNGSNKTDIEDSLLHRRSYYTTQNQSKDLWYSYGMNLNVKHSFDSLGRELTADADYIRFGSTTRQYFTTRYYNLLDEEVNSPYLLRGLLDGQLQIISLKADYTQPLGQGKLEAGLKSSYVNNDNQLAFYDETQGGSVFDSSQSNHFIYQENIHAGYANYSFEKNGYSLQGGLRTEQTVMHGLQKMNAQTFDRNFWQLFPSLFINKKLSSKHEMGLSLSRRIQRPTYEQMNPFKFFIDQSTYKVGNPWLMPQNTYLIELTHQYQQQFMTTLSAGITHKSITEVLIPEEGKNNMTIQTHRNINRQYLYSLGFTAPLKICSWWQSNTDATTYYSLYSGELSGQTIHSGTLSFNAKTVHTFTLPESFLVQVDGFIQYREKYSFSTLSTFGAVNLSIQKSAWNKKASIRLSANDLFYTSRFKGSSHYTNYHEDFAVQRDSRQILLALSYRFGDSHLPAFRRRTGGAEDEKQRAGKNV